MLKFLFYVHVLHISGLFTARLDVILLSSAYF